jgi:hypothetical protein
MADAARFSCPGPLRLQGYRGSTALIAKFAKTPAAATINAVHTGITEYLRNGGKLEVAQQMANHESAWTTGRYDRRNDQVSLDEVERIVI